MEQNELIEKITREVMAKLRDGSPPRRGAEPATSPPPAAPPAARDAAGRPPRGPSPAVDRFLGRATAATPPSTSKVEVRAPADLARYIDHTLLKPEATRDEIDKLCAEAVEHHFYAVCVNSNWVEHCARKLRGTGVKVCSVVGFPLGAMDSRTKGFETRGAIENGADEIDMVINVGLLKSGKTHQVEEDIRWVRRACRPGIVLKVILENALLTDAEKVLACQLAKNAGADFVKTSTGFSKSGATVEDIALMRRTVGPHLGVKAAGGIRTYEVAKAMIEAGATRVGASAGVAMVTGKTSTATY